MGSLAEYNRKRDFQITSEPPGKPGQTASGRSFVIQKHAASHLHYDFRLELDGVLKSWSVPKGPSFDPKVKRLAMATEDHPIEYGDFEGVIPEGQYGGGTVLLWDRGEWEPLGAGNAAADLHAGNLKFRLKGEKLTGTWALVRIKSQAARRSGRPGSDDQRTWLLVKERDAVARPETEWNVTVARPESVATGRDLPQIKAEADRVWHSNRGRPNVAGLPGAEEAPLPRAANLATATKVDQPPGGRDWVHEVEILGERVICRIENGRAALLSATGRDRSRSLPELVRAALAVPCQTGLFDGLATKLGARGTTQRGGKADTLYLVDVLHLDGFDLTASPLERRKALLAELVPAGGGAPASLRFVDHVAVRGADAFREACRLGAPGLVSKRLDAPYRAGTASDWRVARCAPQTKTAVEGSAKATRRSQADTRTQAPTKVRAKAPARTSPKSATQRHPTRPAPKAVAPHPTRGRTEARDHVAGVRLTHPERVVFPEAGLTKRDLAQLYEEIAPFMLPHLEDRPLMIKRCPDGAAGHCFFVKHPGRSAGAELRKVPIVERTKTADYMVVDDVRGLVALAQMNALEIHTWGSRVADLERPDRVVFDLDPGEDVAWDDVVDVARRIREILGHLDLESFVKTTGSKGLHVVAPLVPAAGWDEVFAFTRAVSEAIVAERPGRTTTTIAKSGRRDKILIDYLRNNRGATAVSAYSTRARPAAPVSVPVAWEDLGPRCRSDSILLSHVAERLRRRGDPWRTYGGIRQQLTAKRLKTVLAKSPGRRA